MAEISIVTAFFDLGREHWSGFERPAQVYLDRFRYLTKLTNDITVYTSPDLVDVIQGVSSRIRVIGYDFFEETSTLRSAVRSVHSSPEFRSKVAPELRNNPEYWSAEYVAATSLKAFFVAKAIEDGLINTELVAWVDFGYCREQETVPSPFWEYDFDPNKIHMFIMRDIDASRPIDEVIYSGDVYVQGCQIIAGKSMWKGLAKSMKDSLDSLIQQNLADDDQGLFLMSYLKDPDKFCLRFNHSEDWFILFKEYNKKIAN